MKGVAIGVGTAKFIGKHCEVFFRYTYILYRKISGVLLGAGDQIKKIFKKF